MQLYLTDNGRHIAFEQLTRGKELGFQGLVSSDVLKGGLGGELAKNCRNLGLDMIPLLPLWPNTGDLLRSNPEWAFEDYRGHCSLDFRGGQTPSCPWPSFWCPDPAILELVRQHFENAARVCGDALAGAVISPSHMEAKMPIYWPDREDWVTHYWCRDEYARCEWAEGKPADSPMFEEDNKTLEFCQAAMIRRINEIAELALEFTDNIWVFISAHIRTGQPLTAIEKALVNRYWGDDLDLPGHLINQRNKALHRAKIRAAGYADFDKPLLEWRNQFGVAHGVEVGLFVPNIYSRPISKATAIEGLATDKHGAWRVMTGAQCDEPSWRENIQINPAQAQRAGISEMIFYYEPVCSHASHEFVRDVLATLRR